MTTKTPDVDDFSIESMLAELDEQTAEIIAETAAKSPEPTPEPTPVVEEVEVAPAIEISEEDLAIMAQIENGELPDDAAFAPPSAAAVLDAEQTLDLEEVFEVEAPPSLDDAQAIAAQLEAELNEQIEIEVHADVAVEANKPVTVEVDQPVEIEPDEPVELETKTIPDFTPRPVGGAEKSDKAISELAKMKYQPDIDAFNRDIAFTDATLDIAMTSQASLVARQNELAARAAAQAARLKLKFDGIEAILYEAYRKAFVEAGEKVTEKAIENAVRKDSRWRSAKESVIEAEMYADIHKGFVFSLKDRNDMLIQRGSYRRQEMQGQMRFLETTTAQANSRSSGSEVGTPAAHAAAMRAMGGAKNS